jgi:hypothetical protein
LTNTVAVNYVSTIPEYYLLIFLGFGLAIFIFSLQSKLNISLQENGLSSINLNSYGNVYQFIKTISSWGSFYFISTILIFISSIYPVNETFFRPILYNFAFFIILIVTCYIFLVYTKLVIIELIKSLLKAREYGL